VTGYTWLRQGAMVLKVWFRLRWVDTRLSWDPAQYGNITKTYFQGMHYSGAEDSEIWTPDIQPYNAMHGLVFTLEPSQARVSSDGSVFYSRPGSLEIMCKFSGLVAFPFDTLKCSIEFGGWSLSGEKMGIQLYETGFQFDTQEATSGTSYQEYLIDDVKIERQNYEYDCCPSEPWPMVLYHISLRRASFFYYSVCIIPGILITFLSFSVFFSDTSSSDSLSFGISVIVVNMLGSVVLLGMLPVCGEMIWIDIFTLNNTLFCCVSLSQSALSILLENCEDDTFPLLPEWAIFISRKILQHAAKLSKSKVDSIDQTVRRKLSVQPASNGVLSSGGIHMSHSVRKRQLVFKESCAGILFRQHDREDPSKADPSKVDPTKADPTKADPTKADPTKTDPTEADPTEADPTKAEADDPAAEASVSPPWATQKQPTEPIEPIQPIQHIVGHTARRHQRRRSHDLRLGLSTDMALPATFGQGKALTMEHFIFFERLFFKLVRQHDAADSGIVALTHPTLSQPTRPTPSCCRTPTTRSC
jgi:hypothetical protein